MTDDPLPGVRWVKVHEDRHVPLPSGRNTLWRWLRRAWIPFQFVVALLAVVGVFALMGRVSGLLPQEEEGEGGWAEAPTNGQPAGPSWRSSQTWSK